MVPIVALACESLSMHGGKLSLQSSFLQTHKIGNNDIIVNFICVKGRLNRLNFKGKTNRLKEKLIFTILANFMYFPYISDRNLIIL